MVPNARWASPWIEVERGSAAARHLDEAVSFTQGLVDNGRLEVNEHIADQLRTRMDVEGARRSRPTLVQVVNQAIVEYGDDEAPAQREPRAARVSG